MNTLKLSRSSKFSRTGFTLIELLTVIAIIGILASILIPTVNKVREAAKTATCASNLRQLALGVNLYAQDHDERTPINFDPDDPQTPSPESGTYVEDGRVLGQLIPERLGGPPNVTNDYVDAIEVFYCPSLNDKVYAADSAYKRPETINRTNRIVRTGYAWMFRPQNQTTIGRYYPNDKISHENQNVPYAFDFGWDRGSGGQAPIIGIPSHESVMNVMFLGGHIEAVRIADARKVAGWDNLYLYLAKDPAVFP